MSIDSIPPPTSISVSRANAELPATASGARGSQEGAPASQVAQINRTQPATTAAASEPASAQEISQALDEVRSALAPVAQNLLFSVDEDTGRTIIKVVDKATDEVIKQIPSEEIIAIAKAVDRLQGLLVKQQA